MLNTLTPVLGGSLDLDHLSPKSLARVSGRTSGGYSVYRPMTAATAVAQAPSMKLESLDHVAISVRDVARSAAWYCEVLGLDRLHEDAWGSNPAVVGAGGTGLALFPVEGAGQPPPGHDVLTMRHVAFRVNSAGFEAAQAELRARGVPFTFEDHAISRSIYVHDPDGHRIELTTYDRR